jgi:hypothetical protein
MAIPGEMSRGFCRDGTLPRRKHRKVMATLWPLTHVHRYESCAIGVHATTKATDKKLLVVVVAGSFLLIFGCALSSREVGAAPAGPSGIRLKIESWSHAAFSNEQLSSSFSKASRRTSSRSTRRNLHFRYRFLGAVPIQGGGRS